MISDVKSAANDTVSVVESPIVILPPIITLPSILALPVISKDEPEIPARLTFCETK